MNQTPDQPGEQIPAPTPTPPARNNNFLFGFFFLIGFGILATLAFQFPINTNGLLDNFASEELPNTDLDQHPNGPVFVTPPQIENLDQGILQEVPDVGDQGINILPQPPFAGDEEVVQLFIEITDDGETIVTNEKGEVLEEGEYPAGLVEMLKLMQSGPPLPPSLGPPAGDSPCLGGACETLEREAIEATDEALDKSDQ